MRPNARLADGDRVPDLRGLGDVERERQAPRPWCLSRELFDLALVARGDDGAPAAVEHQLGEIAPEAGRAAGDEPDGGGGVGHGFDILHMWGVVGGRGGRDAPVKSARPLPSPACGRRTGAATIIEIAHPPIDTSLSTRPKLAAGHLSPTRGCPSERDGSMTEVSHARPFGRRIPYFSSGPCPKRPGWTPRGPLRRPVLGRSHRSAARPRPSFVKRSGAHPRNPGKSPRAHSDRASCPASRHRRRSRCRFGAMLGPRGVDVACLGVFRQGLGDGHRQAS